MREQRPDPYDTAMLLVIAVTIVLAALLSFVGWPHTQSSHAQNAHRVAGAQR